MKWIWLSEGAFTPSSPVDSVHLGTFLDLGCNIRLVWVCFTLHFDKRTEPFKWRILPFTCGGAASRITDGEAKKNKEQETSLICRFMQDNFCFHHIT